MKNDKVEPGILEDALATKSFLWNNHEVPDWLVINVVAGLSYPDFNDTWVENFKFSFDCLNVSQV